MTKYLVQKFFWLREKSLIQISQKTLVSLFPFFLFSGIVRVIALSVFSDRGYIYQLFSMDSWLPWDQAMRQLLINFSGAFSDLLRWEIYSWALRSKYGDSWCHCSFGQLDCGFSGIIGEPTQ